MDEIIGYFAYYAGSTLFCFDKALVVTASKKALKRRIKKQGQFVGRYTIQSTTFSEIVQGIESQAEYALDQEAYSRFWPIGLKHGVPLPSQDTIECIGSSYIVLKGTSKTVCGVDGDMDAEIVKKTLFTIKKDIWNCQQILEGTTSQDQRFALQQRIKEIEGLYQQGVELLKIINCDDVVVTLPKDLRDN